MCIPGKRHRNLARSPPFVGLRRKKTDRGHISAFPLEIYIPVRAFDFSRTRVQYSPGSSTINLPSVLTESGAYSLYSACHGTLARAASHHQAFRDSTPCLLRATTSRRAPNWRSEEANLVTTIVKQPNNRRVSTNRLNREDSQLAASLEGESSPTPA